MSYYSNLQNSKLNNDVLLNLPSFNNQVKQLLQIGMKIDDKQRCINFLESVPFHRFLCYVEPFLDENGRCDNLNFLTISKIYGFDRKFRVLILSYVEEIELFLRSQFAYYHTSKYGAYGYLKKENFAESCNVKLFNRAINDTLDDLGIDAQLLEKKPRLPLWQIMESFSLGSLQFFFIDMKTSDKKELASTLYNTKYENVENWLDCLTELRNRSAHYSRLYNSYFQYTPQLTDDVYYTPTHSIYDMLFALRFLYNSPSRFNHKFIPQLKELLENYKKVIRLEDIGFPENWEVKLMTKGNFIKKDII